VTLSPSKAKELKVSSGDAVVLIGRRRRATYGRVQIEKGKKGSCTLSSNLATNLRLRQDDMVKVVPLHAADHEESRSGDLVLLQAKEPPKVKAVTFAPVEDSLKQLESAEGGDEIAEEELQARFVQPYVDNPQQAMVKKGHLLMLRDENNKALEFMVTHIDTENDASESKASEGTCQTTLDFTSIYVC
jgi:translation initiation factor IF-1